MIEKSPPVAPDLRQALIAQIIRLAGGHRLLTDADLEALTGQGRQTWRVRRMRGTAPVFQRIGGRVYYTPDAVADYIARTTARSTAEESARRSA